MMSVERNVVIGCDPSSRKLATVYGIAGHEHAIRFTTKKLPPADKPEACLIAYNWMCELAESQHQYGKVYAAIELPVFGRGGPGSTIPQAQINGALLAGARAAGAEVLMVNNAHAKKVIVGRGNASKVEIKRWVEDEWPELFEAIDGDQDLCDSAMIYQLGVQVVGLRGRVARRLASDKGEKAAVE